MGNQAVKNSSSSERLRFMDASAGSEEFTALFRGGALRYLLPMTTVFIGA